MCLQKKVFISEAIKALILADLKPSSANLCPVADFALGSYSVSVEANQQMKARSLEAPTYTLHIYMYTYIHAYVYTHACTSIYIQTHMVCHH